LAATTFPHEYFGACIETTFTLKKQVGYNNGCISFGFRDIDDKNFSASRTLDRLVGDFDF